MKGPEESYHQALEKLIFGESRRYEPNATTRRDYPILTVQGEPLYSAENHEIHVESTGPEGGQYSLVFDLSEKRAFHAHGNYENQQARGTVEDIRFP